MTDPAHPASPGTGAVSRGPRAASPDPNAAPRSGAPADAPHIGGLLVAKGVVSEDQIRIATIEQKRRQEPLGRILVRFGFATESVIRDVLAGVLGYDTIDLSNVVIDGEVVKLVPKEIARRYRVLPLTWDAAARRLTVATPDPFNVIALDQVRGLFEPGVEVRAALAGEVEIDKAIDRLYGHELSVDGILKEIETGEIDRRSLEAESGEYSRPVVRLVNALLSDAVKRGASDVHFEPEREFLRIRYRIDGVLRQIRSLCATTRNLSVWTVFLWFEIRTELLWSSVSMTATSCFFKTRLFSCRADLASSRVFARFPSRRCWRSGSLSSSSACPRSAGLRSLVGTLDVAGGEGVRDGFGMLFLLAERAVVSTLADGYGSPRPGSVDHLVFLRFGLTLLLLFPLQGWFASSRASFQNPRACSDGMSYRHFHDPPRPYCPLEA